MYIMKLLLINPKPKHYYKSVTCPLGILSIATYLKNRNHIVKIVDSTIKKNNYKKFINEFKPDVVGISLISHKSITDAIKASEVAHSKNIPVVWGGPFASAIPATILKHGSIDYIIIGEGEITWDALLEALEKKTALNNIEGLAYTKGTEIVINKNRAFADLADLPILDWSLVNPSDYFQSLFSAKKMLYLYSGKGCPGQCTFCFNKGFNNCIYRKRPFEYCIQEIEYLVKNCGIDGIHFADELWCRNEKEMIANCSKLDNTGLNIVWGCNARIGTYKREDFERMFRSGCRWMYFGVESGSETIQEEIKKGISLEKVTETINNCVDAGIVAIASFIIGLPDETQDDIKKTIALAKNISRAMYDFNFYTPYEGSEMCDKLIAQGRYKIPESLEDFSKIIPTEKLKANFSKIPTKELKVILAFFMWSSFSRKTASPDSGRYAFTKKAVADAVKGLFGRGFNNFLMSFASDTEDFLEIIFSLIFHPNIRKKYDLYKDK